MAAVFFHREFEEPYGFLSQWYKCSFAHEGVTYVTAEMWMMVQKAKLFGDDVRLQDTCRHCLAFLSSSSQSSEIYHLRFGRI